MKISQYMQYLKILQDRYGDVDVKVETTYEDIHGEYNTEYTDADRPKYDVNNKCILIQKDFKGFD